MKKIICFHSQREENGWLSNWYMSDFRIDGIIFSSMEQYMMYKKADIFGDGEIKREVLSIDDVSKIKSLGRLVKNYNDTVWNGIRQVIVYDGLYAKYSQNKELRDRLLRTGDAILAECAVYDKIWANGVYIKDASRFDISRWSGQNLLGFATMLVRDKIRKEG